MVIKNSEVNMASQSSYSVTTKVSIQETKAPAIRIGDIIIKNIDGATPTENGKLASTGLSVGKDGGFMSSLNYALNQNGEVKQADEVAETESPISNKVARMQTMHYLLRMILLGRLFGDDSSFGQMLMDMFGGSSGVETTTTINYEETESQQLNYVAKGTAVTADGRRINFDYGFEMSESFHQEFKSVQSSFSNFVDPLVINLNDSPTRISNQTFFFDLDGDGKKDEINRLQAGSGFLALDKNEDGEINDGGELFGAKTGDGFSELAAYDLDNNGWIDENDPIFEKLRVWSMNEKGEMELYTLKQSDVGAIHLGRVKSEFIDHDSEHKARAAIRESGIFLHESDGHAGGVQHVDFST